MKQSIANENLESEDSLDLNTEEDLQEDSEEDLEEDLDLMNPSDFIELISNNYIYRKHTGRSRLKLHPKKLNIRNYW